MATSKRPPLDLQARMDRARSDVEEDDAALVPTVIARTLDVGQHSAVGERSADDRPAVDAPALHLVAVAPAVAESTVDPIPTPPPAASVITDNLVTRRKPSLQTFSFQLTEPLDEHLRTIAVTRTDDRGDYVSKTGIVLGAFERGRLPGTPEEAEALVSRIPARFFDSKVTQMSIRIPPETKSALSSMRVRLLQVRSTVLVRDVYMALILDELGELSPA